jgi:hypothetical protein
MQHSHLKSNTDPKENYKKVLVNLIPEKAVNTIADWILHYNFNLKITPSRASKFGDYTAPSKHNRHLITINHDLNPYNFLITLVHEIAHLVTFQKYQLIYRSIKPHGVEWKNEFQTLIKPFLNEEIFPSDVLKSLISYMQNPAASSCSDVQLLRILRNYDKRKTNKVHLEEIPYKSVFKLGSERLFQKGQKLRVRFECIEIKTKRKYLVHPLAEVEPVSQTLFDL